VEVADWECPWQVFLKKKSFFFYQFSDFAYNVALTFCDFFLFQALITHGIFQAVNRVMVSREG
jgi:hypothetical protein